MNHKYNINKLHVVETETEDKLYKKKELFKKFEEFISQSGFTVEKWVKSNAVPYEVIIADKNENQISYRIILYLKNISDAGWVYKPWMKRVQVDNVRSVSPEYYINTERNQALLILGYYNYDDNPIMVAWNPYRYVMHFTQRSCYVTIDEMLEGYKKGYHKCFVSNQKVWIFTANNFRIFLNDYIDSNKVEE